MLTRRQVIGFWIMLALWLVTVFFLVLAQIQDNRLRELNRDKIERIERLLEEMNSTPK